MRHYLEYIIWNTVYFCTIFQEKTIFTSQRSLIISSPPNLITFLRPHSLGQPLNAAVWNKPHQAFTSPLSPSQCHCSRLTGARPNLLGAGSHPSHALWGTSLQPAVGWDQVLPAAPLSTVAPKIRSNASVHLSFTSNYLGEGDRG